jgi:DNA-binding response OmpR family regulator
MKQDSIVLLLVEDNKDFANLVQIYLNKYEPGKFTVIWKDNGDAALREVESNDRIDLILMDYFLPKKNGLEITKALRERKNRLPVIFVTVNRDFDLAIEVMKLGVDDYLVKEEISTAVFPRTIMSVLEKRRLQDQLTGIEISSHRLNAMRRVVSDVLRVVTQPIEQMQKTLERLQTSPSASSHQLYLTIMKDNLNRISQKIMQLKSLNTDKTVPYIRDIRMIDLS